MLIDILQSLLIVSIIFSLIAGFAGMDTKLGFFRGIIFGWKFYAWKYLLFFLVLIVTGVIFGLITIN